MTKLSNITVSHIQSLIRDFPTTSNGTSTLKVYPIDSISPRELQLFWKYHGHFPQEFTQAIINRLQPNYQFVSYDHLSNTVTVNHK
jgi:hypothetical protein